MRNKFGNRKLTIGGETFDSQKEYLRWCELKLLRRAGRIADLDRQVRFELIPAQYENGKCLERAVHYVADFVYQEDGKRVVEDCKGFKTEVYKIKKKLMLYVHGIKIKET